jgi:hypothetical protein
MTPPHSSARGGVDTEMPHASAASRPDTSVEHLPDSLQARIERFAQQPYRPRPAACLSHERLMTLGREPSPDVAPTELQHLDSCDDCADYVTALRHLGKLSPLAARPLTTTAGHIAAGRLAELRGRNPRPSPAEAEHLATCVSCRDARSARGALHELASYVMTSVWRMVSGPRPKPGERPA